MPQKLVVTDEQGQRHVFPEGTTPEQAAQAMGLTMGAAADPNAKIGPKPPTAARGTDLDVRKLDKNNLIRSAQLASSLTPMGPLPAAMVQGGLGYLHGGGTEGAVGAAMGAAVPIARAGFGLAKGALGAVAQSPIARRIALKMIGIPHVVTDLAGQLASGGAKAAPELSAEGQAALRTARGSMSGAPSGPMVGSSPRGGSITVPERLTVPKPSSSGMPTALRMSPAPVAPPRPSAGQNAADYLTKQRLAHEALINALIRGGVQ